MDGAERLTREGILSGGDAGNAEICDLDAAVLQNHNIVGLNVAVDNPTAVRVLERFTNLGGKMQGFAPVEDSLLLHILLERNTLDEFHDNIVNVIRTRNVVDTHNIRV